VLSSTARSHVREFTVGPLSESPSAPGGRQLVAHAANLTYEFAYKAISHRHVLLPNHEVDTHLLSLE